MDDHKRSKRLIYESNIINSQASDNMIGKIEESITLTEMMNTERRTETNGNNIRKERECVCCIIF